MIGMNIAGGRNRRIAPLVLVSCLALILVVAAAIAFAHDPGLSAAVLKLGKDRVDAHLTFARADVETLVAIDTDRDGKVTQAEFERAKPQLQALAADAIEVSSAGQT